MVNFNSLIKFKSNYGVFQVVFGAVARFLQNKREFKSWRKRNFAAPSPNAVKKTRLVANGLPGATWVETGTYLGDTTHFLCQLGVRVITIEPSTKLFNRSAQRFRKKKEVQLFHGTSEEIFPTLLPTLNGSVVFWLDGHFSGGQTFRGKADTPIRYELEAISKVRNNFQRLVVIVDDVRCFNPDSEMWGSYPSIDFLVDWARSNKMHWHIEHDMFVAKDFSTKGELGSLVYLGS